MYILGERIALRRNQLDMTQDDLAAKVGTQQRQISEWERSKVAPSSDKAYLLAKELKVSLDWLYGLTDSMIPSGNDVLTPVEREALEILRSKSKSEQEKIVNVLKALA